MSIVWALQVGSDGVNGAPGQRGENVQCDCGFLCECTGHAKKVYYRKENPLIAFYYGKDGAQGGNGGMAGATGEAALASSFIVPCCIR
jgi:hypothetical protein